MPDILSQAQIDALLKGISSGEVEQPTEPADNSKESRAKPYDFKSPKKFTKEQLRTVDSMHENFSRLFATYLSAVLRVNCDIEILQIEEQRYYEYNNALTDSTLLGLVELHPENPLYSEVTLLVDMSRQVGYFMVDRLLGGSGKGNTYSRDFTEIEQGIVCNIFKRLARDLGESWSNYLTMTAAFQSLETNPRLLQINSPEDIIVIVLMEIKLNDLKGTISICIPGIGLEEMMSGFSHRYTKITKKVGPRADKLRRQVIMDTISESSVEMRAVLDNVVLDLADVIALRVNDVIPLNKKVTDSMTVLVDNKPWFKAKIGETKQKKAVKLTELI